MRIIKKYGIPALLVAALLPAGCAELTMTARIFNMALIELFRLPIYIMRIPFELLRNSGPIIQAGVRSAANLAPLLLFIENEIPSRTLSPDPGRPGELEEEVKLALAPGPSAPLIHVIEGEQRAEGRARFVLIDPRLLDDPEVRRGLLSALGGEGSRVRCVRVDCSGIFDAPARFLEICERMRNRGDALCAATAFGAALAELTGTSAGRLPCDADARVFSLRMERILGEHAAGHHRRG